MTGSGGTDKPTVVLTSLSPRCSLIRSSFRWTAILPLQFGVNLWDFEPSPGVSIPACCNQAVNSGFAAYSDCGKDILKFVDECDKPGVINVDATQPC
jgi:hypothetical protein